MSPGLMLPARTASSRARGMEAALVLPYSARLVITFSRGICGPGAPDLGAETDR